MALTEDTKERTTNALTELEDLICLSLFQAQAPWIVYNPAPVTISDICHGLGLNTTAPVAIIQILLTKLTTEGRVIRNLDNGEERWGLSHDHSLEIEKRIEQQGYIWGTGEWTTQEELNEIHQSACEEAEAEHIAQEFEYLEYYDHCVICHICGDLHLPDALCHPPVEIEYETPPTHGHADQGVSEYCLVCRFNPCIC